MARWARPGTAAQRVPGLAMLAFLQPARRAFFLKSIQDNCYGHRTFFLTVAFVVVSGTGAGQPDAD